MFLEHYKLYWTNFVNFRGRTPRSGYWFVFLWNVIIGVIIGLISVAVITGSILTIIEDIAGSALQNPFGVFGTIETIGAAVGGLVAIIIVVIVWNLANILPGLSLCIRRLHDTGRRWFWIFVLVGPPIAFVAIILISTLSISSGSLDAVLAWGDFMVVFMLAMPLACLACTIIFIVLMCLPTSPDAIGQSTHDKYPQWQDGYGGRSTRGGNASIIGVSGMYKGFEFPLDNDEELILGRDAMLSHIVITEGADKISRKHLTISFDEYDNVYTVTDHSSNGTYLADGTRIVANIPVRLPRGSVVYLAKKENSFKLG